MQPSTRTKRRPGANANITFVDRSIQRLSGILKGIAADNDINELELIDLHSWLSDNDMLRTRHPFEGIADKIEEVLADGVISSDEHADLLWMCDRFRVTDPVFDHITVEIRRLHGYLQGISSDQVVNLAEVDRLHGWCLAHEPLRAVWPFDETLRVLDCVLRDNRIDATEHDQLLQFCAQFAERPKDDAVPPPAADYLPWMMNEAPVLQTLSMVCAVRPEIVFAGRRFCFTGQCQEGDREEMSLKVTNRGGEMTRAVSRHVGYLVVGGNSNPCWTYSSYGRKIEQAIEIQKKGHPLLIVHEDDFMLSVREHPIRPR